ncbi:MAG: UDP-N-acetylglucosamine 2-epimerase (non-hydrolyzing) [Bacteroidota bacterium]|nr:UDP-N-acetylglucosamine 2-epimerase (non-hydrolyzing) [Bacteroidota bacterium]MDP4233042.1 UDP-N-acetylglucosamine 2-epimerase (non-hydrolyzing) [Bacteroidota bacterium]MDP4241813.1 UDP-N-acetylglucosamine 2-epimerase (non-hydrolyzing) [Bacteroidota bacterium]MDP4288766.1 UDP-N-acetylglucosamine 2-epimerase (non-hydrolyzing) [Bacteroidota bacterium]
MPHTRKRIIFIVGARPNFMKVAPVIEAMKRIAPYAFETLLVHTGQHYDTNMSDVFFRDLEMPRPDIFLGAGSGTHAEQTARVMIAMESLLAEEKSDLILVPGDVNSTLATTIVAAKAGRTLGHIESGLRSFDRSMPEEINRIVTDEFSQFCFVTEPSGLENLKHEGIADERVFYVGNTMIDSLYRYLDLARARFPVLSNQLAITNHEYALVTLHRPSNVDDPRSLTMFVELFEAMRSFAPTNGHARIVFPIHPRTRKMLAEYDLLSRVQANDQLVLIDPVGYLDFVALQAHARVVLTDSGGIQEETTALGVPCITLRENTERPVTVSVGTNELVGVDPLQILEYARKAFEGKWKTAAVPELWDGHASDRIVRVLMEVL